MWTHGGLAATIGSPGVENASHPGQQSFKVGSLLLQERSDMNARGGAGAPKRDDLPDLGEGQAQSTSLRDECQDTENVEGITPVAGWCPSGRGQDAAPFV